MNEQKPDAFRVTWGVQVIERYTAELTLETIATTLNLSEDQVRTAHQNGELTRLIETDWLAGREDGKGYDGSFHTADRWIESVELVSPGTL